MPDVVTVVCMYGTFSEHVLRFVCVCVCSCVHACMCVFCVFSIVV